LADITARDKKQETLQGVERRKTRGFKSGEITVLAQLRERRKGRGRRRKEKEGEEKKAGKLEWPFPSSFFFSPHFSFSVPIHAIKLLPQT
jgi:hypothetical protein